MKIVRTPRAIEGFREVASYIARHFGNGDYKFASYTPTQESRICK